MLDEKEWMVDRKNILEKNKKSDLANRFANVWFIGFIPVLIYLGHFLDIWLVFIFWLSPSIIMPRLFPEENIPNSEIIAYHLYNLSSNLNNFKERSAPEKEINRSLKILDNIIRNNEYDSVIFTGNIKKSLYDLLSCLECLNTYIKKGKKTEFNKIADKIKLIADSIRKDDSKITNEFSEATKDLRYHFNKIEPTKITIPFYRYNYDRLKVHWNGLPKISKTIIISAIISLGIWFIPDKIGVLLTPGDKATIIAPFIAIIIKPYIGK